MTEEQLKEILVLLGNEGINVDLLRPNSFRVQGAGMGDKYPDLNMGTSPQDPSWNILLVNDSQFIGLVSDVLGKEVITSDASTTGGAAESSWVIDHRGLGQQEAQFPDKPTWWPDYLGFRWPPMISVPETDLTTGKVTFKRGGFDWDTFIKMESSLGSPQEENILSMDDMIAQSLGKVDDWSDLSDPNLQRAQSLFDFKRQPTDAERLRLAMDFAQSPSDYMTLVGLYTGAISRDSPAKAGERLAPLAPYLQQMAQKFFYGTSLMPTDYMDPGSDEVTGDVSGDVSGEVSDTGEPYHMRVESEYDPSKDTDSILPTGEYMTPEERMLGDADQTVIDRYMAERDRANVPDPFTGIIAPGTFQQGINAPNYDYNASDEGRLEALEGDINPWAPLPPDASTTTFSGREYMTPEERLLGDADTNVVERYKEAISNSPLNNYNASYEDQWEGLDGGIQDLKDGGRVHGDYLGQDKIIKAHAGEMVIPNSIKGKGMVPEDGVWRPTAREFSKWVVKPVTKFLPSLKESAIRFRSPQTIRHMTPTQRMMFQADVEKTFDGKGSYEDWRMQEMLSTGAVGSPGRPRARFRRPSFVRG